MNPPNIDDTDDEDTPALSIPKIGIPLVSGNNKKITTTYTSQPKNRPSKVNSVSETLLCQCFVSDMAAIPSTVQINPLVIPMLIIFIFCWIII